MLIIAPKSRQYNGFKTSTNSVSFPCLNSTFFITASLINCIKESIVFFPFRKTFTTKSVSFDQWIKISKVQTWKMVTYFDLPRNSISHFPVTTSFNFSLINSVGNSILEREFWFLRWETQSVFPKSVWEGSTEILSNMVPASIFWFTRKTKNC